MAAYKRADRVNALLQRELGMLISEELRDPRIAFPPVTAVETTDDLRRARFTRAPPPAAVDLVVTVDVGSVDRAKFALPAGPKLVNIDHHASNDNFGTTNLVDVTAAASAELVSRVIDALGVKWTPEMATAALVGIMTDTGSV